MLKQVPIPEIPFAVVGLNVNHMICLNLPLH